LFHGADLKADGAHARMTAAAVALADGREIVLQGTGDPRVRSHRHLGPKTRSADGNGIDRPRKQVIRYELVVAFEIVADQVEIHDAVIATGAAADDVDGPPVPVIKRTEERLNFGRFNDLLERLALHPA